MFDRYVLGQKSEKHHHHHETTVVEKKAPTDESVRLLKEMEEAATKRFLDSVRIGDTHFECVVSQMQLPAYDTYRWTAIFSLNGNKLTATFEQPAFSCDLQKAVVGLRDAIAEKIATEILRPALSKLDMQRFSREPRA